MTDNSETNIKRKLTTRIITIIILAICLFITTFALTASILVQDNLFETGKVEIDIWGKYYDAAATVPDKSIIHKDEHLFEPGMTVKRPVYIYNESIIPVYCKLYFDEISGGLADILEVTIKDDSGNILYTGKASKLTKANSDISKTEIAGNTKKEYTVFFHYPKYEGNSGQGQCLEFNMVAEAVQTKNNPTKEF